VLPCTTVRTPVALYLVALVVRLVALALFPDPAYPDSFYYTEVARSLAAGHGFSVDFVWIFAEVGGRIPADPVLPIPSNAHWMPLASIVQVPFVWLLGPTGFAAGLPFALLGAIAAPLTWAIARDAGARRPIPVAAGLLVAIPLLLTPFVAQPDNFGLFQPLVAGALWLGARGLRGHARSFALAGLLVGLGTLSRNDGVLVLAALGLIFLGDRWLAWRSGGRRRPSIPWWSAITCAGLGALVVAPWLLRQLTVFGSVSPSSGSGKVLFIRSIEEWNSITTPASLDYLLGQGLGPLLASRAGGLVAAITISSVLAAGIILVPFILVGARSRRRSPDFAPWFVYAAILFGFSALVSAVHVPGGTFIHSAVALVPHASILVLEGIAAAVGWVAVRRRSWDADVATRFFIAAAVGFAAITAIGGTLATHATWDARQDDFRFVAAALDTAGAPVSDRVMSIDAGGTKYWTGHGGVVLVNDPLATIEEVARAYGIRWLVLQRADSVASVAPILDGQARPAWIGAPIATVPAASGPGLEPLPGGAIDLGVYPICTQAGDPRCVETSP
jgi:4-amino-4-deoxy-L-arabinose transferase-like glycosyltransferase